MNRPLIAIPMGDPAGIGPEIIVKALTDPRVQEKARCLVIGDRRVLERACAICRADLQIRSVAAPEACQGQAGVLEMLDLANADPGDFAFGQVSATCGQAAYACIAQAVELAGRRQVAAVATPPINKESLRAAQVPYIGHTEIFAALTGTRDPLTLFEVQGLRVFFLSRHVSLRQAIDLVTCDRIVDYGQRCIHALRDLGVTGGTLAVAGLNPHCGEHGLFGDEEVREVEPAVRALQAMGYAVEGPIGADSVFHLALQGNFQAVLSLYHDQGHIATKTLDFDRTIAITCGLPFLRTSVDHGTAFNIAGQGRASPVSMIEAILLAARYVPFYQPSL
jgi:4-hydroxythreonine-4-phosphate dehydrogenase